MRASPWIIIQSSSLIKLQWEISFQRVNEQFLMQFYLVVYCINQIQHMSISHPNYPQNLFVPSRFIPASNSQRVVYMPPPYPQPQPQPQPQFYPPNQLQYAYSQHLPPQYLAQPAPVIRRHPQFNLNPNFDYESANFLCEAKIIQSTIFCVVCGSEYKMSEKEQHIQKHIRKTHEKNINQSVLQRIQEYNKKQSKPTYAVRPIVEPEEVDVHFDPNVYEVIQEIIYENHKEEDKKEAGIGQDSNNSFNVFDHNVSISHNNNALNVLPNIDSQPNPFFSRYDNVQQHEYHIPEFEIPPPPQKQNNQPQNYVPDQPVIYDEIIPNQLKENRKDMSRNLPDHQEFPQSTIQKEEPINVQPNEPRFSQSKRFESMQPNREFPPEPVEQYGSNNNQAQQFSGPHPIPQNIQQSEKNSEVSLSQYINKLNSEPIVVEDRRRIANQSEW